MAESATPDTPNDTFNTSDQRYADLIRHILNSLDDSTEIAAKFNGGSPELRSRIDTLEGLLGYVRGREGTDLDGLRARFAGQS